MLCLGAQSTPTPTETKQNQIAREYLMWMGLIHETFIHLDERTTKSSINVSVKDWMCEITLILLRIWVKSILRNSKTPSSHEDAINHDTSESNGICQYPWHIYTHSGTGKWSAIINLLTCPISTSRTLQHAYQRSFGRNYYILLQHDIYLFRHFCLKEMRNLKSFQSFRKEIG